MGDCKDNMIPSTPATDKSFGFFKSKKNDKSQGNKELNFADIITAADESLAKLLIKKEVDLKTEKGSEDKNRISLSILRNMSWHLDQIVELGSEYVKKN